jgi:hypothetical protein
MLETRREFLHCSAAMAACALSCAVPLAGQQIVNGMPVPPSHDGPPETTEPATPPRPDPKLIMEEHEKNFREDLDQLFEKVQALKLEADKTPSEQIFSVKIYKQTKEIEKLAKELRHNAKD